MLSVYNSVNNISLFTMSTVKAVPVSFADLEVSPQTPVAGFPIVVDLDGTLTLTDTLVESVLVMIKQQPVTLLFLPFWICQGRAVLKSRVAERVQLSIRMLPLRQDLVEYLTQEKEKGRVLMLATAAHSSIAEPFAARLGLFDAVIATNEQVNLKGINKLAAIEQIYPEGFVYAGDSSADLPIWAKAKGAILAGASASVSSTVHSKHHVEKEFHNAPAGMKAWIKALRVHQWAKNLLLLVPVLTGFAFADMWRFGVIALAFLAFSLTASATYLVNDLWDLDSDRAHPRKCRRPFACASIGILHGLAAAAALLLTAFFIASLISLEFVGMLALYIVLTSAYSWSLKSYVLIDVIMLSVLYTLRILAGSVAVGVSTSSWLLAFSLFLFISLALVKRCSELVSMEQRGLRVSHGRDYRTTDLTVLWPLGCATSIAAVVVFGLFISAPETLVRYESPELMWPATLGLIYWQARMWIKTSRGEMHDDPIVFALRDAGSRNTIFFILVMIATAHFVSLH
jgi:4-hydroxybenzoate polyprenyltransferase/phosphoserine phosphatase